MNELARALHGAMIELEGNLVAAQDLSVSHFQECAGTNMAEGAMNLFSQITKMHDQVRRALDDAGLAIARIDAQTTMASIEAGEQPTRH